MKNPTLHQLIANPDLLKDFLVQKSLIPNEYLMNEWSKMTPSEGEFAFCSGVQPVTNKAVTIYSVYSEDIFYSILFPDYSINQLRQLKALLNLVETVFSKTSSNHNCYNKVMFANNFLTISNKSFTILYLNNQFRLSKYANVILSTNHLFLPNLEFETLYTTILNHFNEKIKTLLTDEIPVVTTSTAIYLLQEKNKDFVKRTHKNRIVKPIDIDGFYNYVANSDSSVQIIYYADYEKNKPLSNNFVYVIDFSESCKFVVGIQKINKLKKMLSSIMLHKDIIELMQLLSIAQFYSNLFHSDFNNNCVEFTYYDILKLSKEKLASNPTYMEISMGIFDFEITDKFIIHNYIEHEAQSFSTVKEAYTYLFNYIQKEICKKLDSQITSITNKDLIVLDMIIC